MENFSQPSLPPHRRTGGHLVFYRLGLLAIFLFSLGLRLWSLDRFNQLAFDEIYYVKYGLNYLRQQPIFDAHPPLGKYLIALGIWLGDRLLFPGLTASSDLTHDLAGKLLSPYSYRWLNAVVGSTIPLLIAGVARQLKNSPSLGLLAGGLAALDGF
ncbi:MAG: phospholipid carrier-dependent glycosyltransferase, partial [Synechococcales cyanobacterium RM1_1_8]|nr:phospholipid carrier-dependent glycosyltransferase [Synechococcales cyanobacterium RM1_1_8]